MRWISGEYVCGAGAVCAMVSDRVAFRGFDNEGGRAMVSWQVCFCYGCGSYVGVRT